MSNETRRGKYTSTTLITRDYDLGNEPPPFLVDGIVHQSMTLLYGQTCSGKSTLAASLAIALANGRADFLGRPIANDGQKLTVGVVAGDPMGAQEYARRLVQHGDIDQGRIYLNEPFRPTRRETWDEVRDTAYSQGWQYIIVDNLSSFVPGSLSDDDKVKMFYNELDEFPREGIPVLVVAHTSEKSGEHGYSRVPMGSSLIRFGPRWWCYLHRSGGYLHLDFDGNEGMPHRVIVTEPDGRPRFDVVGVTTGDELASQRRARSKATLDKNAEIGRFVARLGDGMTGKAKAERIAAEFGGSPATHQSQLSRGVYAQAAA